MARLIARMFIFLLLFSSQIGAVSVNTSTPSKKYPYSLLTPDYGILSENDLAAYAYGIKQHPFNERNGIDGHNYWQCFPRDRISVTLEDQGFSTEDVGWKDTLSELIIEARTDSGVIHRYELRALGMFHLYEKELHQWHKLMKGEKYVCLSGNFVAVTPRTINGRTISEYGWIFDKIKTKKGCSSYWWNSCALSEISETKSHSVFPLHGLVR
ncbi:MAG TPA: hypothetical protein VNC84_06985 [Gammaproteobacteria bacterium]|jgi:hypothetical protein|nr:hypothetical protein [Gammaproteobacteria bacterium]